MQRRLFELESAEPSHYNLTELFRCRGPIDRGALASAVDLVADRHDALTLRLRRESTGWTQRLDPTSRPRLDVVTVGAGSHASVAADVAAAAQSEVDLTAGPPMRVVLIERGSGSGARLLVIAHHVVCDAISWQVLVGDLFAAYEALATGRSPALLSPTTPFAAYARRVDRYARSRAARRQLPAWLSLPWDTAAQIPIDMGAGAGREGKTDAVTALLDAALTRRVAAAARTNGVGVHHVLLTCIADAVAKWIGARTTLVDHYHHGRTPPLDGINLTRTVGWLATLAPALLPTGDAAETLAAAGEQLERGGARSFDYCALRYAGTAEDMAALAALPRAQLYFNYRGAASRLSGEEARAHRFVADDVSPGPWRSPAAERQYLIEVTADEVGAGIVLRWHYSTEAYRPETIRRLSRAALATLGGLTTAPPASRTGAR